MQKAPAENRWTGAADRQGMATVHVPADAEEPTRACHWQMQSATWHVIFFCSNKKHLLALESFLRGTYIRNFTVVLDRNQPLFCCMLQVHYCICQLLLRAWWGYACIVDTWIADASMKHTWTLQLCVAQVERFGGTTLQTQLCVQSTWWDNIWKGFVFLSIYRPLKFKFTAKRFFYTENA